VGSPLNIISSYVESHRPVDRRRPSTSQGGQNPLLIATLYLKRTPRSIYSSERIIVRDIKTDSILALVIASTLVFYQARIDQEFLLSDEGYFWYDGWRTWLGEVPIRDFDGYDPAHYLWCALWFRALGDSSLVAFRLADSIFVFIGTTFGLLALRKVVEWQ